MSRKTHQGHRARKRFGQNFLRDTHIIDQIVTAVMPADNEQAVEIGPGLGALTEPLAERLDTLHVIEIDRDLAHRLRHHPFIRDKLVIHETDALKFDFRSLQENGKKLKIFGNLPYNISTPLLFHLFTFRDIISDMHFMLQQEVVRRMAASPGTKAYGRLTVMTQYFCRVEPILSVPPGAFTPPPKVDSAVVRLTPRPWPLTADDPALLNRLCQAAFGQRRKTLRNSLSQLLNSDQLEQLGINPGSRAEQLTIDDFVRLANYLAQQPDTTP